MMSPVTRSNRAARAIRGLVRRFVLAAVLIAGPAAPALAGPVWTRLELVENTAEGPAYDRCQLESTLKKGQTAHWRIFYGEARADAASGWSAVRPASGCVPVDPAQPVSTLTHRGSPYFVVDVAAGPATLAGRDVTIEAVFATQRLTGFAPGGAPTYENRTEKRTLRVPEGDSAVVPILVATGKETDQFRVRELLLKLRASAAGAKPPVQYGEMAVAADMPRAEIFLDGGFVGRTSTDGPLVLRAVRAGDRQVVVKDASEREAHAVAHVESGRRASVSLALMKDPTPATDGLRPLGKNPQGGEELWREKDGAIVIRIPGGEFQMGSPDTEGDATERPRHAVRLDGFMLDKTEVTWGQYRRYLADTGRAAPKSPIWGTPEALPASNIVWDDAVAYCVWVGARLPTEAEWERAARGDDARTYPWGGTFDPWRCNTRDGGPHAPTAAGSYPDCASPYGVLDLAGSVMEWCSDFYSEAYDAKSPQENPAGPETGTRHVVRGGNWMSASVGVRTASRLGIEPTWATGMQGFRCAQDAGVEAGQ